MEKATITVDIIGRHEAENGTVHVHIENPQCNIRTWVPEAEVEVAKPAKKAETNDEKKAKAETGVKDAKKAETNDEKKD